MKAAAPAPKRYQPLRDWLAGLDAAGSQELLLGGSGHLLLSEAEDDNVSAQLRNGVLPRLFPRGWSGRVCVVTGLAPGADLLFAHVAGAWLRQAGIPCRVAGLLPVPPDVLVEDWLDYAREAGLEPAPEQRRRQLVDVGAALVACDSVVDLMPPGMESQLADRGFRQSQYRRLAACLAQRSDLLVAILRGQNLLKPGGTAEVVEWRRHPTRIPAEYDTRPAARRHAKLIVIDPSVEYTPESGSS